MIKGYFSQYVPSGMLYTLVSNAEFFRVKLLSSGSAGHLAQYEGPLGQSHLIEIKCEPCG